MSTKYTPGPWTGLPQSGQYSNIRRIKNSDGKTVVLLNFSGYRNTDDADVNLIAAAPEMLEALEDLFGADMEYVLMGDGKDDQIAAITKAKAAMAKAKGETK